MKCEKCGAELEKDCTVCPECGEEVHTEQPPVEQTPETDAAAMEKKMKNMKILVAVLSCLVFVALAVLMVLLVLGGRKEPAPTVPETTVATQPPATVPADGNPNDQTCKGSYTVEDDVLLQSLDTVVATAGDSKLTVKMLQVYYWSAVRDFLNRYGQYAGYWGLDMTKPLDMQSCTLEKDVTQTWQQFFLSNALRSWRTYETMETNAEKNGFVMTETSKKHMETLQENLEKAAKDRKMESVEAMLKADLGAGVDLDAYRTYNQTYYMGYDYYMAETEKLEAADAEIEKYFKDHEEELKTQQGITKESGKLVDVRHILIMPEGGKKDDKGKTTYSEEEWEACRKKAQEIYDQWLAGEHTEDTFAESAKKNSKDSNAARGGIYTDVKKGMMVKPYEDWCFDDARKPGDHGLVKTEFGYHIMYFVGSGEAWYRYSKAGVLQLKSQQMLDEMIEKNPITVDYSAIVLGLAKL